ncbi:hypothetical protein JWG42_03160 [Desulfoprunum benzoelyticum]|uniref:Uncharacterized protein n=1 Tax=Desulfoprunum benzoelyticum TaxID=1506996 RepID=A0A840UWU3_9BACT|nr:hypothetical protein [Desulfoprunum benzoelyticum]MBB5349296.1 hypothetical protein [Desulfoprunum benzoelyticum]MBM9529153.1 hypothetical protein [Desulfoprunum benzoelyticum]
MRRNPFFVPFFAGRLPARHLPVIDPSESLVSFSIPSKWEDLKEEFEELIDAAHDLYGDYSIYEVTDLDRPAAIARIVEMYGPAR